jgi:hypothetical protein
MAFAASYLLKVEELNAVEFLKYVEYGSIW